MQSNLVIFNRIPAAILVIGFCVITTSGYTFCQIRNAPMKGRDGKKLFFQPIFPSHTLKLRPGGYPPPFPDLSRHVTSIFW